MKTPLLSVCGVMSGSSLDGLDLAICNFDFDSSTEQIAWSFAKTSAIDIPNAIRDELRNSYHTSAADIYGIEQRFTQFCGNAIHSFLKDTSVDFIGFHGHTVFHEPAQDYTVQIGNCHHLAQQLKIPVVGHFRYKDIALGGQGAPIAPIVEKYLLNDYDAFVNLGGITNISIHDGHHITAYDITVCNQALNHLSQQIGKEYDDRGKIAATGIVDNSLLNELGNLEFLKQKAPKSLSNTWVLSEVIPILDRSDSTIPDKMKTVVEHICLEIARSCDGINRLRTLLVSGGGVHNDYMINTLQAKLASQNISVQKPRAKLADYKEALLMALMAYLRVNEIPNCLASVTGAERDNCGGVIYNPSL